MGRSGAAPKAGKCGAAAVKVSDCVSAVCIGWCSRAWAAGRCGRPIHTDAAAWLQGRWVQRWASQGCINLWQLHDGCARGQLLQRGLADCWL